MAAELRWLVFTILGVVALTGLVMLWGIGKQDTFRQQCEAAGGVAYFGRWSNLCLDPKAIVKPHGA